MHPKISRTFEFLNEGLSYDVPLALLNIDNDSEKVLIHWDRVVIVGLELRSNEADCCLGICGEGKHKSINLFSWLKTTRHDGESKN